MQSNGNGTEVWEKGIQVDLPDGEYEIEVQLTGGSGRASVTSPAILQVQDEKAVIEIEWSSPNYDYMTMDGETYLPVNTEGNSVFELPVTAFDKEVPVTADTTAMSVPHEIEYTLSFALKETDFSELTKTGQWDLSYATQYRVEQYGEYDLITMADDSRFLLVPEKKNEADKKNRSVVYIAFCLHPDIGLWRQPDLLEEWGS